MSILVPGERNTTWVGRAFPPPEQMKGLQLGTSLLGQLGQLKPSCQCFVTLPSLACAAPPYHYTIILICFFFKKKLHIVLCTDLVALSLKDLFDARGEGVFSLQHTNLGSKRYKWYFSPDSHTA